MRIALYSRVSTKDKTQDVENQNLQLEEFCKRQDWNIVYRFSDYISGKTDARKGLQAMFEAARRKEFDCLIFWSLDRLSREGTVETLNHLQRLIGYGVDYKSYTEQYLDSTGIFKEAVIGILAAVAKQERIRISDRTKAGLERTRRAGTVLGRPKAAVDTKKLYEMLATGIKMDAIATHLGTSESTIRRIIRSVA